MAYPTGYPRRIERVTSAYYGGYNLEYVFDIDVDRIIAIKGIQSWHECEAAIEKHYRRPWSTYEIRPQTLTDCGRFLVGFPFGCINSEWKPDGTRYQSECRRIGIDPQSTLPIAIPRDHVDNVIANFPFIEAVLE